MIENKNTRMDVPKSNDSGLEDSKLDNSKLEDLKITTIKEVFGGLPLDKRRKLAYEFLDLAQICTPYKFEVPDIDSKFIKWICSGNNDKLVEADISHLFLIWTYAKHCAIGGIIAPDPYPDEYGKEQSYISIHADPEYGNNFQIWTTHDGNGRTIITKEEFFTRVLENSIPNNFGLDAQADNYNGRVYQFPFDGYSDASHEDEKVSIEGLIKHYDWRVKE